MAIFSANFLYCFIAQSRITAGYSQIKVNSSGNVGIKTFNPISHFAIGDSGLSDCKALVHSQNSGIRMGLYVRQVPNNDIFNYGIISVVSNVANNWKMTGIYATSLRSANTEHVYTMLETMQKTTSI